MSRRLDAARLGEPNERAVDEVDFGGGVITEIAVHRALDARRLARGERGGEARGARCMEQRIQCAGRDSLHGWDRFARGAGDDEALAQKDAHRAEAVAVGEGAAVGPAGRGGDGVERGVEQQL